MKRNRKMRFVTDLINITLVMVMPVLIFCRQTHSTDFYNHRLELKPATITCRSKEYQGMKGTLYVPEDRTKKDSKILELPVVIVKSLSPNPDYPIFRFAGGPGLTNLNIQENLNELELSTHDIVEVGYRGIDGNVKLKHPLFDEILRTSNFLTQTKLREIGNKLTKAVKLLKAEEINVAQFNILNVVDDTEAARMALGYEKIDITGGSYGGAVVMAYCLRYPHSIHRAVMLEAAFPYDIAFGKPAQFDARLNHINELWKKNAEAAKRSPDIVQTIRNVLAKLPKEHNGIPIDPSKLRFMTSFGITNQRSYANMVFDAYVSAEKGDFNSIAAMCLMYDQLIGLLGLPGDLLAKTYSSVTDPDRNFISELQDTDSVLGSPMSMFAWGSFQYSEWPVNSIVKEHPPTQKSNVETLIFYGSKQTGEPFKNKYSENFKNGHWVILDDLGHTDIWTITADGTNHLIRTFIDEGVVDTSKFGKTPQWDFTPQVTFYQMLQQMLRQRLGSSID